MGLEGTVRCVSTCSGTKSQHNDENQNYLIQLMPIMKIMMDRHNQNNEIYCQITSLHKMTKYD